MQGYVLQCIQESLIASEILSRLVVNSENPNSLSPCRFLSSTLHFFPNMQIKSNATSLSTFAGFFIVADKSNIRSIFSNGVLNILFLIRINPRYHRLVVHKNVDNSKPFKISYKVLYQHELRFCQLNIRDFFKNFQQPPIPVVVVIIEGGLYSAEGILF